MDTLTKIESSKVWSYIAIGSGVFAVIGIALAVKETMEADKTAKVKEAVIEDAVAVAKTGNGNGSEEGAESFSGCGGCTSNATGRDSLTQGLKTSWQF